MSTALSIQIFSGDKLNQESKELFNERDCSSETEFLLLQRLHEYLSMVLPISKAIRLDVKIEVKDVPAANFLINKKVKSGYKVTTQKLTEREVEIIGLIMQGLTNQQMAEKLFISYETVRSHRKNILWKTGSKNTACMINHYCNKSMLPIMVIMNMLSYELLI